MKKITLLTLLVSINMALNSQNKLLSKIDESYNINTWEKSHGTDYEYDSNNNLLTETDYRWESNSWKIVGKISYSYNSNNKVTEELYQEWNTTNNTFENSYRDIYSYVNDKITEIVSEQWENLNWVNDFKIVVTYNNKNLPEIVSFYEWIDSNWVYDQRLMYTYNANNKLIYYISQEWNGTELVNDYRISYTYNSNNKLVIETDESWDIFNSNWIENSRTDFEYDNSGNKIKEYNNQSSKEEYTYDSSNLMSNFAHPFKDKTGFDYETQDFPYVNKILSYNYFNYNSQINNYVNSQRTTYNYENSITLGTETLKLLGTAIQVYPNPAKDLLFIKNESNSIIDNIRISDITGKVILQQNQNTTQINIQNLSKGMYFLELFVGGKKETRKFMKE